MSAFAVRGIERIRDFDSQQDQCFKFHGTPGDAVFQRRAFQKFHGNKRFPILFADVIDSGE